MGMREAGSVDIEASSRKTTGKSIIRKELEPAVMQVVHIWNVEVRRGNESERGTAHDVRKFEDRVSHR